MPDYKRMYHLLLNEIDVTIENFKKALSDAEDMYIESSEGDELELDNDIKEKAFSLMSVFQDAAQF